MKQGGKSIIGLWKWNSSAIFEKGDFVIKGENIYRVNSTTIEGTDPDVDLGNGAYELYPGNRIDTKEEYEEIVNNSESAKDLYVSSSALNSILKDVYFGLDSNGIIDSTIDVSEENVITTSEDISTTSGKDILDELIDTKNKGYNNGTIKVSKNLPSIKNLVGHPDESELIPRNGKRWVVCDRGDEVEGGDANSPTRCRKCWECVRACKNGRIKKTIDNKLVINNGDPENINEISDDIASGFEDAVNICPYHSLSYTSSSEAAIAESNYYLSSSNGVSEIPTKDLIVFGAKTYKKKEQQTTPGEYAWVQTGSSTLESYYLIGIAMPGSMFETYTNVEYMNRIKSRVEELLVLSTNSLGGSVQWYKEPGEDLATGSGIISQQTSENNGVRTTITVTETYSQTAYQPKAICMFRVSNTTTLSQVVEAMLAIKEEIDNSYNNTSSYSFNWKQYISYNNYSYSAALPNAITIFTGTLQATAVTYEYQQQGSTTTDVYKTASYSPYLCAFIDALDCMGEAIGGSEYAKCRITQSASSADPTLAPAWPNLRTRRFPSKWSSTLYPDTTKTTLDQYPINTYWDFWGDPNIEDHSAQKNYYANWRDERFDDFYAASYNLTGNIFCVKIPEEAIQYLNVNNSSLSTEQKQALGSRVQAILSRPGTWPNAVGSTITGFMTAGGATNLQGLQDIISLMGYCDSVFNITFGRYQDNTYITGSSEFVQGVENKIRNHEYYYKLDQAESALGNAGVFDAYTIDTTLEEWQRYASNNLSDYYLHGDTNVGWSVSGNEGPGFALLPRVLYSEWTNLVLSANLESDEAGGTNNSNLLLVPRWLSEGSNSPVGSGQCYTNEDDRTPFWTQLHGDEGASSSGNAGSRIDTNIKFIEGYFDNNFFVSTADKYAILKQYSYYGSSGELLRVQELIDPDYGEMFIRSTKNLDWKPCVVNDKNTVRKMARLFSTLDTFRQSPSAETQITNSTYGTSAMNTWRKDAGWELSEAINDRHYFVRNNVAPAVFILLVKAGNKYYNITIYTSRNSVDATYNITQDISISVKYSTNLNKVFIICSYGVDLEDIYYGK